MDTNTIRTSVDDLYELVQRKKRISVEDAAKELHVSTTVIHSLVDFLVEEKVFGIEYKFTTPYIYISRERTKNKGAESDSGLITKEQFFERAQSKNVPEEQIHELWRKYISENLANIKDQFYQKSAAKGIPQEKIDQLWNKYLSYIQ